MAPAGAAETPKPAVAQQPPKMMMPAQPLTMAPDQAREIQQLRMQMQAMQSQMSAMSNQLNEFRALYNVHTHHVHGINSTPSVYRQDLQGAILRDGGGPVTVVTTRNIEAVRTTSKPMP
jgi:hypothetical protein